MCVSSSPREGEETDALCGTACDAKLWAIISKPERGYFKIRKRNYSEVYCCFLPNIESNPSWLVLLICGLVKKYANKLK